ncbi:MAG: membrane protein insertase YidC, partial [Gammaproteobacteria bacterium]
MGNVRLILFVALALVLLLMWEAWQKDYGQRPAPQPSQVTQKGAGEHPAVQEVPKLPEQAQVQALPQRAAQEQRVHVRTDVLDLEIGSRGGDILRADLLKYAVSIDKPDEPVRLLNDDLPHFFIAQSGNLKAPPSHRDIFTPEKLDYRLGEGQDRLEVVLTWKGEGVSVDKIYTFHRGSYLIEVEHRIHNTSQAPWKGRMYGQFQRTGWFPQESSRFIHTFTGPAFHTQEERYRKVSFDEIAAHDVAFDGHGGWVAMLQHYFVTAWIPPQEGENHFYARALPGERYLVGVVTPEKAIGEEGKLSMRLYLGPKIQRLLAEAAPGLELTVDYGFLWFISQPLFWVLEKINLVVGNWGWSIVILTLLIKLAFYPLSAKSYRSMANMRKLQPKLAELKERYGDDRQRMSQAMMELYKREKVNPLGGCLPILVQIPVFIAL